MFVQGIPLDADAALAGNQDVLAGLVVEIDAIAVLSERRRDPLDDLVGVDQRLAVVSHVAVGHLDLVDVERFADGVRSHPSRERRGH